MFVKPYTTDPGWSCHLWPHDLKKNCIDWTRNWQGLEFSRVNPPKSWAVGPHPPSPASSLEDSQSNEQTIRNHASSKSAFSVLISTAEFQSQSAGKKPHKSLTRVTSQDVENPSCFADMWWRKLMSTHKQVFLRLRFRNALMSAPRKSTSTMVLSCVFLV